MENGFDLWNIYTILQFAGIGVIAGILAGLFGVGGGLIMGPFLIFYLEGIGFPSEILVQFVFGTVLFIIILTSSLSVWRHHRSGNVIWRAVLPLGIFSILGAFAGATIVAYTPGSILKRVYGAALFFFAYRFIREIKSDTQIEPRYDLPAAIPSGFIIGLVGSLLGVGGGVVGVPLMALFLHYPFRKIAGTSSAVIIFTAISAVAAYIFHGWGNPLLPPGSLGFVNFSIAVPLMIGAFLGAPSGVYIHGKLPTRVLRILFAVFLAAEGVKLLW